MRRRMMMGGSAKPYDAEVEYLESTGTQWIDTGVIPDFNFGISIDFVALSSNSRLFGTSFRNKGIWGGVTISNYTYYDGGQMTWLNNEKAYNPAIAQYDNQRIFITAISNGNCVNYITDKGYRIVLPLVTTSSVHGSFYLYTFNTESLVINASMRIYSCELYSRNNRVRDFIPVRVGNVGYMYDRVSGQLFGNAGTGQFIIGPDK